MSVRGSRVRTTKSPKIIQTLEPSYEDILKLDPDVILDVKSSGDKDRYDKLSAIAPTVAIPKGGENYLASTEQQTTMIAKALGKESEGKKLLSGLDDAYAAARKAHPDFEGKTAVVGAYSSEGFGAYASTDSRSTFMRNLGFEIPKAIDEQAGKEFSVHLSDENLDLLDADLTLILPIYVDASEASSNNAVPEGAVGRGRARDRLRRQGRLVGVLDGHHGRDRVGARQAAGAVRGEARLGLVVAAGRFHRSVPRKRQGAADGPVAPCRFRSSGEEERG